MQQWEQTRIQPFFWGTLAKSEPPLCFALKPKPPQPDHLVLAAPGSPQPWGNSSLSPPRPRAQSAGRAGVCLFGFRGWGGGISFLEGKRCFCLHSLCAHRSPCCSGCCWARGHELQEVEAALSVRTAGVGAAGAALRTRLVAVPDACGRFTCFPISLQVLQFSPGLF